MSLPVESLDQLFNKAHTAHGFHDKPVDEELLKQALQLSQMGPTAFNTLPMRVVFIKSPENKKKLEEALMAGNIPQTSEAPVTAIVCFDEDYVEKLKELSPYYDAYTLFKANEGMVQPTKTLNGTLQAGYFLLALRSVGLDIGPMSGFSNEKVDELFLADTKWKSSFLVNIGYSNAEKNWPRNPKLAFEDAAQII